MHTTGQPARKVSASLWLARQRDGGQQNKAVRRKPGVTAMLEQQRQIGNRALQRLLAARQPEGGGIAGQPVGNEVEDEIQRARGGGQALDAGARARLEPALGADFGGVRVHADGRADELNAALEARAFTTGQDIFFRQGQYDPGSATGRELLAHELTHVVQQGGGVQAKLTVGAVDDEFEQEADTTARQVMRQEQEFVPPQAGPLAAGEEEAVQDD